MPHARHAGHNNEAGYSRKKKKKAKLKTASWKLGRDSKLNWSWIWGSLGVSSVKFLPSEIMPWDALPNDWYSHENMTLRYARLKKKHICSFVAIRPPFPFHFGSHWSVCRHTASLVTAILYAAFPQTKRDQTKRDQSLDCKPSACWPSISSLPQLKTRPEGVTWASLSDGTSWSSLSSHAVFLHHLHATVWME